MTIGLYDVFGVRPFNGNQAAVISGMILDDFQLVLIAGELLLPETVAANDSGGILEFRFATADGLVRRCGHGVLAGIADHVFGSSSAARGEQMGDCKMDGQICAWKTEVISEIAATVTLAWPDKPAAQGGLPREAVLQTLGLQPGDLAEDLPLAIYDSGNLNGLVPLKDTSALQRATPDFDALRRLHDEHSLADLHLYTITDLDAGTQTCRLRCRNVFPYGVREECATGTASLSLSMALMDHQARRGTPWDGGRFIYEQGIGKRRGHIEVIVPPGNAADGQVCLRGQVFKIVTGQFLANPVTVISHHA